MWYYLYNCISTRRKIEIESEKKREKGPRKTSPVDESGRLNRLRDKSKTPYYYIIIILIMVILSGDSRAIWTTPLLAQFFLDKTNSTLKNFQSVTCDEITKKTDNFFINDAEIVQK